MYNVLLRIIKSHFAIYRIIYADINVMISFGNL